MLERILSVLAALFCLDAFGGEPIWGDWTGHLDLGSARLEFQVSLAESGPSTIDIPMQNLHGAPLSVLSSDARTVVFSLAGVPGDPVFRGEMTDGRLMGHLRQFGREFPFELSRPAAGPGLAAADAARARPAPYRSEDVVFRSAAIDIRGTLTCPAGSGAHPAILLVSGSGVQDRDSQVFGHRPFEVLADHLTRNQIAVLRFDDPQRGTSADDVLAAFRYLLGQPGCPVSSAGILGHSAGGLLAAQASVRSDDVAFLVLLATPGIPMRQLVEAQVTRLATSAQADDVALAELGQHLGNFLDAVQESDGVRVLDAGRQLLEAQLKLANESLALSDADVELMLRPYLSDSFRSLLAIDAADALRKVRPPVLALFGEHDWQVEPGPNSIAAEKALLESACEDVTVSILPGLNHLFQEAPDGNPAKYGSIEQTMSPLALWSITDWLQSRAVR